MVRFGLPHIFNTCMLLPVLDSLGTISAEFVAGGQTIRFVDLALGWLDILISILKNIAGLNIVQEERLSLLSAWIQDFADAQITKGNWPPQAQMLANCHALLDASCTAAASK